VADSDTSQVVRLVIYKPRADFGATPLTGPAPLQVAFKDLSVGNPTVWAWDFGDGGASAEQNPTHTYVADGSYTVALSVTNERGTDTVTKVGFITVITPMPHADFSGTPTAGPAPLKVSFTDLSTGSPASWLWDFGDGQGSDHRSPNHVYGAAGAYTVTLTVTNVTGADVMTKTGYITVSPPPPGADFTGTPTRGIAPLLVAFADGSTRNPTAWAWDFGGAGTSTEQNPSFTFTIVGTHTVTMTASNVYGSDREAKEKYILVTFPDVPLDYWSMEQVISCVDAGIVQGYPDGTYKPTAAITRDQMAVYISRALAQGDTNVPDASTQTFPDVPTDHWAYRYIQFANAQGVVEGYSDGTYKPSVQLDRGQMAVFIARSICTPTGDAGMASYTPGATDTFPDVASDHWAFKYIGYVKYRSVVQGYPDGTYRPDAICTRDQMAVYVTRAFQLPL
jgi:PKD repeat protein